MFFPKLKISLAVLVIVSFGFFFAVPISFSASIINVDANVAGTCVDSSWTPDPNTVCAGTSFAQISNCGNSRSFVGTKSCSSGGGGGGGAITPPADSQAPSILRLEVRELGSQSAKIYWQTDENAFSKLRFGLTNNYEKGELPDNRLQSSGDFSLTGLVPGSRYFFRLILTDSNGNQTISESFLDTRTDDKIDETAGSCPKSADINSDRRVNLVDFSILLFNWGRLSNQHADLNCDGQVDLTDFSILLYYWQG